MILLIKTLWDLSRTTDLDELIWKEFFYPNLIVERQSYEKIFSKSDNFGSGPNLCGANADRRRQLQPLSFEQTKEKPPHIFSYYYYI